MTVQTPKMHYYICIFHLFYFSDWGEIERKVHSCAIIHLKKQLLIIQIQCSSIATLPQYIPQPFPSDELNEFFTCRKHWRAYYMKNRMCFRLSVPSMKRAGEMCIITVSLNIHLLSVCSVCVRSRIYLTLAENYVETGDKQCQNTAIYSLYLDSLLRVLKHQY